MDEKIQKILDYCNNNPKTKKIIVDLKTAIDEIEYSFTNFKDKINELARRLNADNICKTDKISRVIKRLLIDKIKEGKISAKWIEECLPREYKRNYTIKSEVSSLILKNT